MLHKKLTCLFLNWWESPTHPRKLDQLKVTLWFSLCLGWRQICLGYQVGYDMFLNGFFYKLILWSLLPSPVCPERTWPSQNQKQHILWIWNPITRTALWRLLPVMIRTCKTNFIYFYMYWYWSHRDSHLHCSTGLWPHLFSWLMRSSLLWLRAAPYCTLLRTVTYCCSDAIVLVTPIVRVTLLFSLLKRNKYVGILSIAVTTLQYITISMITIFSMYIVHVR